MAENFRLQSKAIGLTYAQCGTAKEVLLPWLKAKVELWAPQYVCVSHEKHQDGGDHLHAVIILGKKPNIRSSNFFDFDGFHPNIQAVRDIKHWTDYVQKDGDYVDDGKRPEFKRARDEIVAEALKADTREEFLSTLREKAPSLFLCSYIGISKYAADRYGTSATRYVSPHSDWIRCKAIDDWFAKVADRRDRYDLLVVVGPTKLGKTSYIRSFGHHVYWKSLINIESLIAGINEGAGYLVIDDPTYESDLDKFPFAKTLLLGTAGTVTDKYTKKADLQRGLPCVLVVNELPLMGPYWRDNSVVVYVDSPLFRL